MNWTSQFDPRAQQQQQPNGRDPNIVIVALAMTTRGSSPLRHGIATLALYVGDSVGNMLESHAWKVAPLHPNQSFEPPGSILSVADQPGPVTAPDEVMHRLGAILAARPCAYLASENVTRDASFLNAYLDHFGLPLVTRVHDAFEYARGALRRPFNLQVIDHEVVQHQLPRMRVPLSQTHSSTALEAAQKLYLNHIALVTHLILSQ